MSIKLDMEKTYDRLEWPFIEKVLGAHAFCDEWVSRIIKCISSTSLSILLNGSPVGNLKSSRGLRKGCPRMFLSSVLMPFPVCWNTRPLMTRESRLRKMDLKLRISLC